MRLPLTWRRIRFEPASISPRSPRAKVPPSDRMCERQQGTEASTSTSFQCSLCDPLALAHTSPAVRVPHSAAFTHCRRTYDLISPDATGALASTHQTACGTEAWRQRHAAGASRCTGDWRVRSERSEAKRSPISPCGHRPARPSRLLPACAPLAGAFPAADRACAGSVQERARPDAWCSSAAATWILPSAPSRRQRRDARI